MLVKQSGKKQYLLLFKKLALVILLIYVFDFIIGTLLSNLYFSNKSSESDRFIHSMLHTSEDILVFGSSKAMHHYNPKILADSLGMTCFNVGSGGQNIYFHLAILESTLERYKPEIVILELSTIDFEKTLSQWDTDKLGALLPFVKKSDAAKNAVLRRGKSEKVKLVSSIYPFNSLLYTALRNNLFPINNHQNGYIPIDRIWDGIKREDIKNSFQLDGSKLDASYKFIDLCQANAIQIFICISPHYALHKSRSEYSDIINKIKEKFAIEVFDFENDSTFMENVGYFADPLHLNQIGADIYTSQIAHEIKKRNKSNGNMTNSN